MQVRIEIKGMSFVPPLAVCNPGDKVLWTNNETMPHTATGDNPQAKNYFDSGDITPDGGCWEKVFEQLGDHHYHCTHHPHMKGVVRVQK